MRCRLRSPPAWCGRVSRRLTPRPWRSSPKHRSEKPKSQRRITGGKLTGQKPALKMKEVWSIRARLELKKRVRDLALFNLAVDSKLRACDLTALKVEDDLRGPANVCILRRVSGRILVQCVNAALAHRDRTKLVAPGLATGLGSLSRSMARRARNGLMSPSVVVGNLLTQSPRAPDVIRIPDLLRSAPKL